MALFIRNFRRNISDVYTIFCKDFEKREPRFKLWDNNNNKEQLRRHCSVTSIGCVRNITSRNFSYEDDKNGHSFDKFIKGMAFLPAGLLSIFNKKEDTEPESELVTTIKRGVLLIQKEEFKKAEQMLHVALKLAQEQDSYDGITYIYDLLANLALEQKEYKKAETLFVNVMNRLLSKGVPQSDNKIIHMSLKLANIFKMQKDASSLKKAEEGYKFCIQNLRANIDKGSSDEDTILLYAMSLDWYARFLVDMGRHPEAFNCFKKAYELCLQINGEVHEETVVLLNDLGTLCIVQDDYDTAISYLKRAVDIGDKLPDMKDYGYVLANLVAVYIKKGMHEEAKKFCSKAWKNAKQHNNEEILKELNEFFDEIKKLEATAH